MEHRNKLEKRRKLGQWYTKMSPFDHPAVEEWLAEVACQGLAVVEPFAGRGDLIKMLPQVNWMGFYDIDPPPSVGIDICQRDSIKDFPTHAKDGAIYGAAITNPPWFNYRLHRGRTSKVQDKKNMDDLYEEAMAAMLENIDWVAAILPESFVSQHRFDRRLWVVIILTEDVFGSATEHPACLALFRPEANGDPQIWRGDECLGDYSKLRAHPVFDIQKERLLNINFCDPQGEVGIYCADSRRGSRIRFTVGSDIDPVRVKRSSRHVVRAKMPFEIDHKSLYLLISRANQILEDFRNATFDVTLTSFKSRGSNGLYRRRLDFKTAARILSLAYKEAELASLSDCQLKR